MSVVSDTHHMHLSVIIYIGGILYKNSVQGSFLHARMIIVYGNIVYIVRFLICHQPWPPPRDHHWIQLVPSLRYPRFPQVCWKRDHCSECYLNPPCYLNQWFGYCCCPRYHRCCCCCWCCCCFHSGWPQPTVPPLLWRWLTWIYSH